MTFLKFYAVAAALVLSLPVVADEPGDSWNRLADLQGSVLEEHARAAVNASEFMFDGPTMNAQDFNNVEGSLDELYASPGGLLEAADQLLAEASTAILNQDYATADTKMNSALLKIAACDNRNDVCEAILATY